MSYGLHDAVVGVQRRVQQVLAVSSHSRAFHYNGAAFLLDALLEHLQSGHRGLQRISLVVVVICVQQIRILVGDNHFCRSRAGVDADEHADLLLALLQLSFRHVDYVSRLVPLLERHLLCEQRRKRFFLLGYVASVLAQLAFKFLGVHQSVLMLSHESRSQRCEQLRELWRFVVLFLEFEQADERVSERLDVGERTAAEHDLRQDVASSRQRVDGLQSHSVEY